MPTCIDLRSRFDKTRDDLGHTMEYLGCHTVNYGYKADRELSEAKENLKRQEGRAWRQASASLTEMHREDLQRIMGRIFVATNAHQPRRHFFQVLS